ncbi:hypothetical protein OSB04_018979 [Centaurea solstitialis]|uniref:CCHC-type domain-containing protein n=1 Tax=Centaurea solstitialis TaxID=347529 RepID=A0AA38T2T6_9ASTR|nr:hypothetical protein OSB04_018979 [Centaurea solstitialis]
MVENLLPPPTHSTSNITLLSILSKGKLTVPNYLDWIRSLRISLRYEDKEYLLDEDLPILEDGAIPEAVVEYDKHGMLRSVEASMGKTQSAHSTAPVLAIREGGCKKKKVSHPKGKGKAKAVPCNQGPKRKAETSDISPTSDPKEAICFYCQEKVHWKRSCPKYLEDLNMNKAKGCGTSGIFKIELHSTLVSNSWILDTGCSTHICSNSQGLKESRTLKHGELNLIMGNRMTAVVTKIGDLELVLSSGLSIKLLDCCYSQDMAQNIISFNALYKDGFKSKFDNDNGCILVYKNGCFYFKATPCNDVYESVICLGRNNNNLTLNVGSSNSELNKSSFWHHRLVHINKKRIAKLQSNGILESFDLKSDEESHILNLVPTKKVAKTPSEMWTRTRPSLAHIKVWGCEVSIWRKTNDKLEPRAEKCLFVGDTPIAKIKSIRILLAIAAFHDYEIWQMDAKTAFLNGKLDEDVYMAQPEGFVHAKYLDKVCKLKRPVVSFALSMVSRYQGNPGESHWTAVKNILKYLWRTKDVFLVYDGKDELQDTVADSTCESEYIPASEAAKEAWLKNFIGDLGVIPSMSEPIEIFCDNEGAFALTKEPKDHGKSKHIEMKYHFVRHKVEDKQIMVGKVPTKENPTDPFTKTLTRPKHEYHTEAIGVRNINLS